MNGSNFNLSSLLCSRGNVSCSKEPKYTSKSSSTYPYQRTYALSKQFQEIGCQSNALFDEISEHARLVRHAYHFRTILACLMPGFQRHENILPKENLVLDLPKKTAEPVLWTWPKPSSCSSALRVLLIHLTEKCQHRPALVSSSNSKYFLHNEKVIGLMK